MRRATWAWMLLLMGCSVEDRLHGTWQLERTAIHQTDADTLALTYPATQVDECIALWGYDAADCREWYDDIIQKSIFYNFDAVSGVVAIIQRSCAEGVCGDAATTSPFSVYRVDGERHVAIGASSGRGLGLSFEAGELRLRDVAVSCNDNSYYYYYYEETEAGCQSTVTEWTFSRN